MVLTTQEKIENIKHLLNSLETEIEYDNAGGNYDVNKYAEDFYKGLINLICSNWKMVNLNEITDNYPAIDLGDKDARIGIQITSDTSIEKIKETFEKFYRHNLDKEYNTVYILTIKQKKIPSKTITLTQNTIGFNKNKHIIDNTDLLKWIRESDFNLEKLSKIETYIRNEIKKKPNLFKKILLPILEKANLLTKYANQPLKILYTGNFQYDDLTFNKVAFAVFLQQLSVLKNKVDLIIFSGNLVKKAEKATIFDELQEHIITPIIHCLNISIDKVFFTIGTSDISEQAVWAEAMLKQLPNTDLDIFLEQNRYTKEAILSKMRAFKEFEENYSRLEHKLVSNFDSSFIIENKQLHIGINMLNSVWKFDNKVSDLPVTIGRLQFANGLSYILDCDYKIASSYFPFDLLDTFEQKFIEEDFNKYNIVFFSSTEKSAIYKDKFKNNTLYVVADTTFNKFSFKHITYDFAKENVVIDKYINIGDVYEHSCESISFPTVHDIEQQNIYKSILEYLKDKTSDFDKLILTYHADTTAPKHLNGIFVMPKITDIVDGENVIDYHKPDVKQYQLSDFINSQDNYLIFGESESGKSFILNKILIDFLDKYNELNIFPVYINCTENRNNDILTSIKNYIGRTHLDTVEMLNRGMLILLIDNLIINDESTEFIVKLNTFKETYPKNRIIATSNIVSKSDIPFQYADLTKSCLFKAIMIQDFGTKQIRSLATKWFENHDINNNDTIIDDITKKFSAFSLPRTPMAVSLYLWIVEKQQQKLVNHSVLLENFIDSILDKLGKTQIYRGKFDAHNKRILVAEIAYYMLKQSEHDNYSIEYGNLISFIDEHLLKNSLNSSKLKVFIPKTILDDLISRGLLLLNNGLVRFRFECFFHFFLAIQMKSNKNFYEEVLTEDNYLSYVNEIDYYTGLERNNEDILQLVYDRLKLTFQDLNGVITAKDINMFFHEQTSISEQVDMTKVITTKPTQEEKERIQDKNLSLNPAKKNIDRKKQRVKNPLRLLKLASYVLRNSEEVRKPELKSKVYYEIVRDTTLFLCTQKYDLIRDVLSKYQTKKDISFWGIDFHSFLKILPLIYQLSLYNWLGSPKLLTIIYDKINHDENDKNISDIEQFLSVFIFSDIKNKNMKDVLDRYIVKFAKTNTIIDLSFLKLLLYYSLRSKPNTEEEKLYLDLLVKLKHKSNPNMDINRLKQKTTKELMQLRENNYEE